MTVEVDAAPPKRASLIGLVLADRYRVEAKLGEGAMGAVYKATHVKVGRAFAVKVLHPHLLIDDKILQRFEREAELAGRLRHPNVIGVVDVGELPDQTRYMVMDFAAGPDLATLLSEAPMPGPRIIHLVRQMLEGLYHAHESGLIHRDFKPENVIIEKDTHGMEVPRIVDFGIAILREGGDSADSPGRLTTNGLVLGTPHYMAPEQAVADPIDHRIDLFALGLMIYEMLCGRLPFDGNGAEIARANLLLDPPPIRDRVPGLEVDPLLEAFARRLMAKKRDARPANAKVARELLDLVERDRAKAAAALGVKIEAARVAIATTDVAPPAPASSRWGNETFPPPVREPVREPEHRIQTDPVGAGASRRRWPVLAMALASVLAVAVGAYAVFHKTESEPVATNAPAPTPSKPEPAPTPLPAPAPPPAPPPVTVAEPSPTPTPEPPVGATTKPAPVAAVKHPAHPKGAATTKVVQTKPIETKPTETKPAEPPALDPHTGNGFAALYAKVGRELNAYQDAHGKDATDRLWRSYRLIVYGQAMNVQAARDEAVVVLQKLHADIAH